VAWLEPAWLRGGRSLFQPGQAGQGMLIIGLQDQDIFQAGLLLGAGIQDGAEPEPGRDIFAIYLDDTQQKLFSALALILLRCRNPLI
jgi:hypothetical protein